MATHIRSLHLEHDTPETGVQKRPRPVIQKRTAWDPERFAEEQIRNLVRQVFFPGSQRPARQIVFCSVDEKDISGICLRVGQALSAQIPGTVCVVEADSDALSVASRNGDAGREFIFSQRDSHSLHKLSRPLSGNLCLLPQEAFLGDSGCVTSAAWLRARLGELRLEFDYAVLHGPPARLHSEVALLGQLSDGVVLVVEANSTRRATAQSVKRMLQAANVRLLGAVLNQRGFPIPEGIYRKL